MSAPLAYLLKKFPRTSETFILNELLAQEAHGRQIHIFSRRLPDDEPRHPQLAELKATVENLPDKRELDPWEILFLGSDPDAVFGQVGKVVREGREWGHSRFPSLLTEALWMWHRTRELGIQHIHTHFATDSAVVALLLKLLGGPTYSMTMHAKDIYRSTVDTTMFDRLIAESEFSVTVCNANVDWIAERVGDVARSKVRRLYNGIDLANFEFHGAPRDDNHVLSVGRVVEKKGFDILVDAIDILKKDAAFADLRVTFIGDGDSREAVEKQIAELGLGETITMLGAQDSETVRQYMERATVMCAPCIIGEDGNRDALPTVLLESLARGLPCVSTPVTGIPEILDQGNCGLIVPERDAAATAEALRTLLSDSARREEIAKVGRERAEKLFDRRETSAILDAWFSEVVTDRGVSCASPA